MLERGSLQFFWCCAHTAAAVAAHRYWLTGNSCNPSCDQSDPLYPNCDRKNMGYCGDHDTSADKGRPDKYPEEFWSCSDVRIVRKL